MPAQDKKIWLSPPHMGGEELYFIQQAFQENWIAPLGPNVSGFEQDIEQYLGEDKYVAALSSGTAAMHLALVLLGIGVGDEVLCQSLTFAASVNPVLYVGATPVFIDSEPNSGNMCPHLLEEAIEHRLKHGKKPKAIIAVHLYGMPYMHDEINAVAEKYEIPVIEDSAEALGSSYKGQPCGTLGNMSVLSFNGNKIITTSGGGALVTRTKALKDKSVFLVTQAKDEAPHYEHSTLGYNYRMSNVCAGIGRGQIKVLADRVLEKRTIFDKYALFFENIAGVSPFKTYDATAYSNHWLSVILINEEETAGKTPAMLMKAFDEVNIESRPLWKPMHLQPLYKDCLYFGSGVSDRLFKTGLCLPSGTGMVEEDYNRIFGVLTSFFK